MPQPARLIWANNRDNQAGVTLTGTGHSDVIDLAQVEAVFFSVVVGSPPDDMQRDGLGLGSRLRVSLQVQDAGGTWLPVAVLKPRRVNFAGESPMPFYADQPHDYTSVGLFLPQSSESSSILAPTRPTLPLVLPQYARVRWDVESVGVPLGAFGQTVISLYGR
ncbi:hypothetical protein OHA77_05010 [Streptosporangium sp. NBC_01639]|uniref:hypothetical protein n=1 Tax=Streptosporangium sp. NBC_01639 TaxID=2975948 RepID=UPI003868B75E|nr:hypothetical protein OHA77_05010 [Streptosporangium sp. NBC_01639]